MIQTPQIAGIEIAPRDGASTPASIQSLVVYLVAENQELKDRLNRIEEQLHQMGIGALDVRPAVIWRWLRFGSQSEVGSQFVASILTVITTLNLQGRDVLEFLSQVCKASRFGSPMPSLLPQT